MTTALSGMRVMVPVTSGRRELADAVGEAGAEALEVEFLAIAPAGDPLLLERAVRDWSAGRYEWMTFTSRNAVLAMATTASALGLSLTRAMPTAKVAAVGDASRSVCEAVGVPVALIPATATAQGLVADFPEGTGRVLVPLGDRAPETVATGLALKGWSVDAIEAYRTVAGAGLTAEQARGLAQGTVDAVLLTSGSMATLLAAACPDVHPSTTMVAMGPTTAAAAAAAGLAVTAVAERPTYEALVATLISLIGRTAP
ncbi:MAG: uroporphyrinogen-III synthase [Demequinaceae bacterium]|nr:uroporphyrinogen-III synthase [Demequinaceae bacterium]